MREILFKAKRIDNGEWVEGWYYPQYDDLSIAYILDNVGGFVHEVIPETVCQYTGLTDKNGNKIFEGDILNVAGDLIPVKYLDGSFHIIALINQGRSPLIDDRAKRTEVIGNIHDKNIIDFKQLQLETAKNVLITLGKDIQRVKEEFNKKQNESDISPTEPVRPI